MAIWGYNPTYRSYNSTSDWQGAHLVQKTIGFIQAIGVNMCTMMFRNSLSEIYRCSKTGDGKNTPASQEKNNK